MAKVVRVKYEAEVEVADGQTEAFKALKARILDVVRTTSGVLRTSGEWVDITPIKASDEVESSKVDVPAADDGHPVPKIQAYVETPIRNIPRG